MTESPKRPPNSDPEPADSAAGEVPQPAREDDEPGQDVAGRSDEPTVDAPTGWTPPPSRALPSEPSPADEQATQWTFPPASRPLSSEPQSPERPPEAPDEPTPPPPAESEDEGGPAEPLPPVPFGRPTAELPDEEPTEEEPAWTDLPPVAPPPPPPSRRTGSRCLFLSALILLGCGLLSTLLAIGGALLGLGRFATPLEISPGIGEARDIVTQSYTVAATPRLVVRSENGRTEVRAGSSQAIQVEAIKRARGANADQLLRGIELEMRQSGDTVTLGQSSRGPSFSLFSGGSASVDFIVTVPSGTAVDVESDNGRILVEGVRGGVVARSDNGPVTLRQTEGAIALRTNNGAATVDGARGRLEVTTDNGPISVSDAQSDALRLRSSNGTVTFNGDLGEGEHEIRTSNGRVAVMLARDERVRLDVQTSNGSITNRLTIADVQQERNSLKGTLNGGSNAPLLTIRTQNGSVVLDTR